MLLKTAVAEEEEEEGGEAVDVAGGCRWNAPPPQRPAIQVAGNHLPFPVRVPVCRHNLRRAIAVEVGDNDGSRTRHAPPYRGTCILRGRLQRHHLVVGPLVQDQRPSPAAGRGGRTLD